ncbi:MAG: glycosyltransferase family 87 protein [Anaerolineae bacterium]
MVVNELKSKSVYVLWAISVVVLTLAYQVKAPIQIDLGEKGDGSYLRNFHDAERADGVSYRWSSDRSSVALPGIGGNAPALLRVRLNGSRPSGLPLPRVSIAANGHEVASFTATDQFETYEFAVSRGTVGISGNLEVEIRPEFFVPNQVMGGGDLRQLGVLVDFVSLELRGGATAIVIPALLPAIYVIGGVSAIYLLARWVLSRRGAFAVGVLVLLALSLAAAVSRIYLAPHAFWVLAIPGLGVLIMELAHRTPPMAKGIPLSTALVLGAVLGLWRFASVAELSWMGVAPDLANNYTGAVVLRSGGMIYDTDLPLFVGYDNPPLTAILTMPLTLFDLQTAIRLFLSLNVLLLIASLALVFVTNRDYLLRYPYWLISLALVLNLDPVLDSVLLGQLDLLILFLIVAAYWGYRSGREVVAGASLGLAAMIKISPGLLILYFLFKRRFRVVASAFATVALIGSLSLLVAGPNTHRQFITDILPTLLAGSAQMENQSLNGFFNRLFLEASFLTDLAEVPPLPQVRILTLLTSVLLIAIVALLLRKRPVTESELGFDVEYSLVVILLPLISSIAWHHYMTWCVLPLLVLVNPRLRRSLPRRTSLVLATVALVSYMTLCIPIATYATSFLGGPAKILLSMRLYAGLALFGIFAYLIARLPVGHGTEVSRWNGYEPEEISL